MLSINTNLSSLIAQRSMKQSTNSLNQAIERMTTGAKINHSKDNAANYSIATNMDTKIGSLQVAEDNVLSGLDMVNTASESLSLIEDKLTRLRALATQASNGTYGDKSLTAINAEASALVDELGRTYSTAAYNGIKVFKGTSKIEIPDGVGVQTAATYSLRATNYGNFIDNPCTYTDEEVAAMTTMTQAVSESSLISGGIYSISTVDELVALAEYVNSGNRASGMIFVLGDDIDLSSISNWTPIGDYSTNSIYMFCGTFDGNGHVIKNLKIDRAKGCQGLFGKTDNGGEIKNVGIEGGSVKGQSEIGMLAGITSGAFKIFNCYATGNVTGNFDVGGLVGLCAEISNSYATGSVSGNFDVGGLVGTYHKNVKNCYATGNVTGNSCVGGLAGSCLNQTNITNSYATGNVTGTRKVGGLVGGGLKGGVSNSYATGKVSGADNVGGLVGEIWFRCDVNSSYSTGAVSGNSFVGGLVGQAYIPSTYTPRKITNCLSYSTVSGNDSDSTGSLIGGAVVTTDNTSFGTINITDCQVLSQDMNTIGGSYMHASSTYTLLATYDMSAMLAGISLYKPPLTSMTLQVGTSTPDSNQITFDMAFELDGFNGLAQIGLDTTTDFVKITDNLLSIVSAKQTEYGAVQNRLESALDEISTQYENLVSSRSTLQDANIAEVSSEYIRQQILQQASATLLATANQSPSIALQLI